MFVFPDDAQWNAAEDAVEFGVEFGEYRGRAFLPRRVLHNLIGSNPAPELCIQHFHLHRAEFERLVEEKIRGRALDDDANIRVSGRDIGLYRSRSGS